MEKIIKNIYGIAVDEQKRIQKENNKHKLLPLVEWSMKEKDCLEYCYKKGFFWKENNIRLYDVLDRVSCWCCSNKNNKELKNYYLYLPKYFEKIRKLTYEIWINATNSSLEENAYKFWIKLEGVRFRVSKFNYDVFYDEEGQCIIAVSKQKYSKEQAVELAKRELNTEKIIPSEEEMYVRYGLGTMDEEKKQGYWLECRKTKISIPVWSFKI
ncbi:MAG: hypothetical protein HFJ26_01675 [Clostridia bacterium]|nr:hypothetical protein [Clostridia bacterium]